MQGKNGNDGGQGWTITFSDVLLTKSGFFPNTSKEQIKGKQSLLDWILKLKMIITLPESILEVRGQETINSNGKRRGNAREEGQWTMVTTTKNMSAMTTSWHKNIWNQMGLKCHSPDSYTIKTRQFSNIDFYSIFYYWKILKNIPWGMMKTRNNQ